MSTQPLTPSRPGTVQTLRCSREFANAIGMVGKVVTYGNRQWILHSVEGPSWYAFDDQGVTTVDATMTPASWITEPVAMIIPTGHLIGEGFGREVYLSQVQRGVCLSKSWA